MPKQRWWRWATVTLVALGLGGLGGDQWSHDHAPAPTAAATNWPVVGVVRSAGASVVVVLNQQPTPGGLATKGLGSGVVLGSNGTIVTNYHVIRGAKRIIVITNQNQRFTAKVVGSDPSTDLAVLKVQAGAPLKALPITTTPPDPGALVVAIGNSLGLEHTVTAGVVSALDRVMYRDGWEFHLLQTDAAINPGNSGGALINMQGQLIGINSSKIAQAGVEGIAFAIPTRTVEYVVGQILEHGKVRRPWIGATLQVVPGNSAPGIFVVGVTPGGPGYQAGLRTGDWLLAMNHERVKSLTDVTHVLEGMSVGQRVMLTVMRGTQMMPIEVSLQEAPSALEQPVVKPGAPSPRPAPGR